MMKKTLGVVAFATLLLVPAGCSGAQKSDTKSTANVSATTKPPTGDSGPITWATYRATNSLDPITSLDVPENVVVDSLCEALLRQAPDLSVGPGLAESVEYSDSTTLVIRLRPGVTFSDGAPLTPADVVFSLDRARDASSGSFYPGVFANVKSIAPLGDREIEIVLARPDYWLRGELSGMAGTIIQRKFASSKGKEYGTPAAGVMCTGPFVLESWKAGGDVVIKRNPKYWDEDRRPKTSEITFKGVESDANLSAAFSTGDVDGTYNPVLSTYDQLAKNKSLTVSRGPSLTTDALVVGNMKGLLGDVRVRRALSLALDRQAYIDAVYHGQAELPRSSSNPGSWGYSRPVFDEQLGSAPVLSQDLAKAKQLIEEGGAGGKTLVIATAPALPSVNTQATIVAEAAKRLGLKVELKSLAPDSYGTLFFDPAAREGVDIFGTLNNPNFGDPAPYLASFATPEGAQNYSGWSDPEVSKLLTEARATADDDIRAGLVAHADKKITAALPWIPLAQPYAVQVASNQITGAPSSFMYMNGPWASMIGSS